MSEEQKVRTEKIMKDVDSLNEESKELVIAYIRGMADAARMMDDRKTG